MSKFHVVLVARAAGMPHNVRVETTANSQREAENNALYLFRKHGHAVFNVGPQSFKADLKRFNSLIAVNRPQLIQIAEFETDELWVKAINLRAFLPPRVH